MPLPPGRPKGPPPVIARELGEELMNSYTSGTSPEDLSRYCREVHGLTISAARIRKWLKKQFQARSIASMRAVGDKIELVMGDEIDELLKFKGFCLDTALEIWRNLQDSQKYTARSAFKFLEAYQKAQAQIFVLHGLAEAAKAGQTMDDISHKLNEKFDKLSAALNSTDEDPQPPRDE